MHVQVAAHVFEAQQVLWRVGGVQLAQLGRAIRSAEQRVQLLLGRRLRQPAEARHVSRRAGRTHELGSEPLRRRRHDLDRMALGGHAHDAPLAALEHGQDLRQRLDVGQRTVTRHDDGEPRREVAPAPRIAGRLPAESRCELADERPGAVQQHPVPWTRRRARRLEPGPDPLGRLRADPGHGLEPAGCRRFTQLRERAHPERVSQLPHPLGREPEQAAHADELGHRLGLELAQLGQLAGLDELAQASLDPRPDPGELARAARADERGHVRRRRADQLGSAAICTHRVEAGAVQVQQRREGVELLGQGDVVHSGIVSPER